MKQKLIIATHNPGKMREFREALKSLNLELISAREAGIDRFPPEKGTSYKENALMKAGYAALETRLPSLGDDSGLEVDALNGAPGVYSARYGGDLTSGERVAHLLSQLREVPKMARGARFVCELVLATPSGQMLSFGGVSEGRLTEGPRGEGGFGYDPIFYSPELGKTFAEATEEEKRTVSHRGRALQAFIDWALTSQAKRTMRETDAPKEEMDA